MSSTSMSKSCDPTLELSKEHGKDETNVEQINNDTNTELQKNEKKGELTDAFFVDLLNESSSDSDSDINTSFNSKSFDVNTSNGIGNEKSVNCVDSTLNNINNVNQNSEKKKDGTINLILTSASDERNYKIIKDTIQQAVNEVSMDEIECCVKNITSDIISDIETSSLRLDGKKSETVDLNNFNGHRETEEWTDDESASSTSSSDSSDDDFFDELHKVSTPKIIPIKTKGELDIEDLPPIEELNISVEKSELTKVGKVHAIVTKQVVVQAVKDQTPLDMDSVLFLSENKPLGRIFEVFGPVVEPFYVVLFNSEEDIKEKNINVGTEVYFAPKKRDITMYVFLDVLRQQKGSDASWADNNEPPEEFLDYSDDEQERIAKMKRRAKNRNREDDDEVDVIAVKSTSKNEGSLNDSSRNSKSVRKSNYMGNSSENIARNDYTSKHSTRNFVATENFRNTCNRSQSSHNTNSLDNVPVWISSPPPFLEVTPISSSPIKVHNTSQLQSLNFTQTTSLSRPRLEFSSPVSTNSPQFKFPQVQLRAPVFQTMQSFIPSQAANTSAAPVYLQSVSSSKSSQRINNSPSPHPAMVSQSQNPYMFNQMNSNNTHSFQTPIVFQSQSSQINTQNASIQSNHVPLQLQRSHVLSNYRQPYVFGQLTPIPIASSIPFSSPVQNPAIPMQVYVGSPQPHMAGIPHWQQREASISPSLPNVVNSNHQWQQRETLHTPPVSGTANPQWQQREPLRTPPLNSSSRVQIPSFTNLPPVIRFGESSSWPIPPPKPAYYTASDQNGQFSYRFQS